MRTLIWDEIAFWAADERVTADEIEQAREWLAHGYTELLPTLADSLQNSEAADRVAMLHPDVVGGI